MAATDRGGRPPRALMRASPCRAVPHVERNEAVLRGCRCTGRTATCLSTRAIFRQCEGGRRDGRGHIKPLSCAATRTLAMWEWARACSTEWVEVSVRKRPGAPSAVAATRWAGNASCALERHVHRAAWRCVRPRLVPKLRLARLPTTRWTRDSAVQMGAYLPRIKRRPWVRRLVEGAISALAFFILQVGRVGALVHPAGRDRPHQVHPGGGPSRRLDGLVSCGIVRMGGVLHHKWLGHGLFWRFWLSKRCVGRSSLPAAASRTRSTTRQLRSHGQRRALF